MDIFDAILIIGIAVFVFACWQVSMIFGLFSLAIALIIIGLVGSALSNSGEKPRKGGGK